MCNNTSVVNLLNCFELFDIDINYDIDVNNLEEKYVSLQVINGSDNDISKKINHAYQILSDNVMRAEHLLFILYNIEISDEMNCDPEFLEEMFDLMHDAEQVKNNGANIELYLKKLREYIKEVDLTIKNIFRDDSKKNDFLYNVLKLKYLTRCYNNIKYN